MLSRAKNYIEDICRRQVQSNKNQGEYQQFDMVLLHRWK